MSWWALTRAARWDQEEGKFCCVENAFPMKLGNFNRRQSLQWCGNFIIELQGWLPLRPLRIVLLIGIVQAPFHRVAVGGADPKCHLSRDESVHAALEFIGLGLVEIVHP